MGVIASRNKIPAIQALRALSLILVLVFHLSPDFLPSGYLGVDAFFAISGFVITLLITRGIENDTFSLRQFYWSRAFRLLPALFVTVLFTIIFFKVGIGYSDDFFNLLKSSIATLFSVSNVFFYTESGYFSDSSLAKPLLHTWSLGVEEQFYLFFPIFYLWANKQKHVLGLLFIIALLGIAISLYASVADPDLIFFLSPFRAYQFLFGVVFARLYLCELPLSNRLSGQLSTGLQSFIIVVVIGLCFQDYDNVQSQVIAQTLVAFFVGLSCWLAALNRNAAAKSFIIDRVFGMIGDRSYSIYLVHWPIIVFIHMVFDGYVFESFVGLSSSFLFCLACGFILHRYVEVRYRQNASGSISLHSRLKLAVFLITPLILSLYFLTKEVAVLDKGSFVVSAKTLKESRRLAMADFGCRGPIIRMAVLPPMFDAECYNAIDADLEPKLNVLMVGDSLLPDTRLALSLNQNMRLSSASLDGCPPYFGGEQETIDIMKKRLAACRKPSEFPWSISVVERFLEKTNYDVLVVTGNWYTDFFSAEDHRKTFAKLNELSIPVIIIGVRPFLKESVPRKLEFTVPTDRPQSQIALNNWSKSFTQSELNKQIEVISGEYGNILFFNAFDYLCPNSECKLIDSSGNSLYLDRSHLSKYGAEYFSQSELANLILSAPRHRVQSKFMLGD